MRGRFLLVVAGAFLFSSVALAGPAYVGASVAQSSIEVSDEGFDFNGDDTGYKVFGGFRFLKFFGVEGSYVDLGAPSDDVAIIGLDVEIDATAWDAFAVGVIPLGPFEIFGKAGMIWWDADLSASIGPSESDSGSDAAYGVGFAFKIAKVAIRAEYEQFDIEDTENVDQASVGLEFRF